MFERYKTLVGGNDDAHVPFVRAASAERCVDSATNWTSGKHIGFLFFPYLLLTRGKVSRLQVEEQSSQF